MKTPVFKPSKTFVHDYRVPCLAAKLENSQVAGIGELHRKETKEDPVCQVFLRGTNAREISPWQRQMLKRLFEQDELVSAVATGMKDYEKSTGYEDPDAIQPEGILPHLYLTRVIIDERQQEVIICAHTLVDGNLDEHGIAISSKKGRWKFGSLDYLNDYLRNLDLDEPAVPVRRASAPSVRDLFGTWVLDEEATTKLLTTRGMKSYVKSTLKDFHGAFFEVSEGRIRRFDEGRLAEGKIVKCEWKGKQAWLTYRVAGEKYDGMWGGKLQKDKLVGDDVVFRRLAPGEAAPASPWSEMDPAPLLGVWENDGKASGVSMTFKLEISRDRIVQTMKAMGAVQLMEFRWSQCATNGSVIRLDTRMISPKGESPYPITFLLKNNRLRWESWVLERKDGSTS
jgi:hypothetical protein